MRPSIFTYLSCHQYMAALLNHATEGKHRRSLSSLEKALGRARGFLTNIRNGHRGLGEGSVDAVARVFRLSYEERVYLLELVRLQNAKSELDRIPIIDRLVALRPRHEPERLTYDQREYLEQWYHMALRELAGLPGSSGDPEVAGGQLIPPIPGEDAGSALSVLESLGYITRKGDVLERAGNPEVEMGPEAPVRLMGHAKTLHTDLLGLARDSMRIHRSRRYLNGKTFRVPAEAMPELKSRIDAFLANEFQDRPGADTVLHVEIALFPIATTRNEDLTEELKVKDEGNGKTAKEVS